MKRIIYLLAALPMLFLWNCSGDDFEQDTPNPIPEAGNQIKFEIGFAPQNDGKPQTRVATDATFKSTWENNDAIGIFAVKRASGESKALTATGNYMHNVKLTYSTANGGKWTPASDLWHASGSDVLDFYAYYPYEAIVNPTAFAFAVKADQRGASYNQSDLLMAKKANVAKSANAVSLQFAHALSLVQVEFVSGGRGANIDALAKVTMKATTTTKPFSLSATSIEASAEAASDIVMTKVAGLTNTYRALVPAQTIAADKTLFAVTRGDRLVYTTSTETTLAQAKAARYKVTLIAPTIDPNHVYAVGDRYPHVGLTEGIVYWLKDPMDKKSKNGMIVSLDEGQGGWGVYGKNESNDVIGIRNYDDGKTATKNLIAKRRDDTNFSINYYAFNWIYQTKNKGDASGIWYLPAQNELIALHTAYAVDKIAFNGKLSATSGTVLSSNYYWSSSELDYNYAWLVDFSDGSTYYCNKTDVNRVRGVSAF